MARDKSSPPDNRRDILRYTGLSAEVCASVGFSVFLGIKGDKWLHVPFPILTWFLPLLVIVVLIIKLVKESTKRKDGN